MTQTFRRVTRSGFTALLVSMFFSLSSYSVWADETLASVIEEEFTSAATEFGVPADLLKAISYVETRFNHIMPDWVLSPSDPHAHQHVYGIMGLRDDDWFGSSLTRGAELIGVPTSVVLLDRRQNIRAAAAYLRSLVSVWNFPDAIHPASEESLNYWAPVLTTYSGIPAQTTTQGVLDATDSTSYAHEVYRLLAGGVEHRGITIGKHDVFVPQDPFTAQNAFDPAGAEYPKATWDPSPNITRSSTPPAYVVIHTTQGSFAGAVSWLKNPRARVSAHYVIRSRDGYIAQLVLERNKAWHALCWNPYTVGIEHEGFVQNPDFYTEAMYASSAALSGYLTAKYRITPSITTVVGHDFGTKPEFKNSPLARIGNCNTHGDPGRYWNWPQYLDRVTQKNSEHLAE